LNNQSRSSNRSNDNSTSVKTSGKKSPSVSSGFKASSSSGFNKADQKLYDRELARCYSQRSQQLLEEDPFYGSPGVSLICLSRGPHADVPIVKIPVESREQRLPLRDIESRLCVSLGVPVRIGRKAFTSQISDEGVFQSKRLWVCFYLHY